MRLSIKGIAFPMVLAAMAAVFLTQIINGGADQTGQGGPPFSGTIFIDPDIITPSDSNRVSEPVVHWAGGSGDV